MLIDTDANWCWLMLIDADAGWCSNRVQPCLFVGAYCRSFSGHFICALLKLSNTDLNDMQRGDFLQALSKVSSCVLLHLALKRVCSVLLNIWISDTSFAEECQWCFTAPLTNGTGTVPNFGANPTGVSKYTNVQIYFPLSQRKFIQEFIINK